MTVTILPLQTSSKNTILVSPQLTWEMVAKTCANSSYPVAGRCNHSNCRRTTDSTERCKSSWGRTVVARDSLPAVRRTAVGTAPRRHSAAAAVVDLRPTVVAVAAIALNRRQRRI